ncbi:MFS transporter [Corynebacterium phoceense]|uniref:MFS transporter n=1 Tax=Corynebacterium phoceense TaxID=1686286 RepID=UPI00211C97A2|nr:MFS transporter [Corynebacterium phoceense]MCQ9346196.1 MFS transporter [Corynebacterium phoceense]
MSEEKSVPNPREVITTKALWVWVAAMAVYTMAITGRTSFGVASLDAIERFDSTAGAIAVFTSIQVGTYALAQIPTGVAIDKFGPRAMLVAGALVMGIGQVVLGFTSNYWVAVAARVLIGAGDATAFLSVMRILPYWFPLHRTPMFTQVTSALGQLGQFISAIPFLWYLGVTGWTTAFVTLGAVGILVALAASVAVADSPEKLGILPAAAPSDAPVPSLRARLAAVVTSATAWNCFFIHFSGMLAAPVFVMMWGMPLMTQAMGLSDAAAGIVLTLNTVFMVLSGPIHGRISARLSGVRDWVALAFAATHIVCWALFFATGSPRGFWVVVVMMFVMALLQPVSNYGFDKIRERLPHDVVATATGLANMGGFVAGMLGAQIMGMVLSSRGMEWADFRHGALAVLGVWLFGLAGIVVTHFVEKRFQPHAPRRVKIIAIEDDAAEDAV